MSKTTKSLLLIFTSILLLFTIYWFEPFKLSISRNNNGGLTVYLLVFIKSPFVTKAKSYHAPLLSKELDLNHSLSKMFSSHPITLSPECVFFSEEEEIKELKPSPCVKCSSQNDSIYTVSKSRPPTYSSDRVIFSKDGQIKEPKPIYNYTVSKSNDHKQYPRPFVFDEKDVVVLGEKNFTHFIANNRYVVVDFYAHWSPLSRRLGPEYAAAATMLKGEASKAVLAKVNCAVQTELARKYKIQAYPRLYFFVGGVHMDEYYGLRTRDAIATWVKRKMIPDVYNVTTTEEAEHILAAGSTIVLGFLDTLEGPESEELAAASKLQTDVTFYQTASDRVAKIFQIDPKLKRPALVVLQNQAEVYSQFDGQFTRLEIADFVSINKLPLVITYNLETSPLVLKNPLKQLWLVASANDPEIMSHFQEAAKFFKGKLLFVYVETVYDVETPLYFRFGVNGVTRVTSFTVSHPQIFTYSTRGYIPKKHVLDGELTISNIKSFGEDFLENWPPVRSNSRESSKEW